MSTNVDNSQLSAEQIFQNGWGYTFNEAYEKIKSLFQITNETEDVTRNLLNMLNNVIDKTVDWDTHINDIPKYFAAFRLVSSLVNMAFDNSARWKSRSPYIELDGMVLAADTPEYYIDLIFDDIVSALDEEEWLEGFKVLLANHIRPDKNTEYKRKDITQLCWMINMMNGHLFTLKYKALPLIEKLLTDEVLNNQQLAETA